MARVTASTLWDCFVVVSSWWTRATIFWHRCSNAIAFFAIVLGSFLGVSLVILLVATLSSTPKPSPAPEGHIIWKLLSFLPLYWRAVRADPSAGRRAIGLLALRVWEHTWILRLRAASSAVTFPVKGKLLLSFALIVAQIGNVYQIHYPPGYQSLTSKLFRCQRVEPEPELRTTHQCGA